ncbi:MAG: O-antigen ligase family protein, partial [Cyanobacteria bacterium REEB65]|nr:O-antigen ligase family protein [Cyanobacteria bacterium REEB65]
MFNSLSLGSLDGAWRATVANSLIGRLAAGLRDHATARLSEVLPTSVAARLAPMASGLALLALLFAAPLVSTSKVALLVVLAFGFTVLHAVTHPPLEDGSSPLDLPYLILWAIVLVAAAASPFPLASIKGLAKLIVYALAYYVFRDAFRRGGARSYLAIGAFLLAAWIQSAYGIYQYHIHVAPLADWEDANSAVYVTRVFGTLRNPNLLGGYLLPAIPLAIAGALSWRGLARYLALALAITGPIALYFTFSTGAYVALGAEFAVIGALSFWQAGWNRRTGTLALATIAVAAVGLVLAYHHVPAFHERVGRLFTERGDSSNNFRMNVWQGVLPLIRDSWWLGVGIGNAAFRHGYALYMVSGYEALGAYNIFLEWAAEAGVFAALAFT